MHGLSSSVEGGCDGTTYVEFPVPMRVGNFDFSSELLLVQQPENPLVLWHVHCLQPPQPGPSSTSDNQFSAMHGRWFLFNHNSPCTSEVST